MARPLTMGVSRVAELRAAAAALAEADTVPDALTALFDRVLDVVGAASGALWLADADGASLRWAGGAGIEATIPSEFQAIPLDAPVPGPEVVRTGVPITYATPEERNRRWPALATSPTRVQSVAALPVPGRAGTAGVLGIGFTEPRGFDEADLEFLGAVADEVGYALERARLLAAERESRSLLEYLARITQTLADKLDPDEVLRELCRLAVPQLADWAALYVPREGVLVRIEQVIVDHPDEAARLVGRFPVDPTADTPVATAYRTAQLQLVGRITPDLIAGTHPDPEFVDLVSRLGVRTGVVVPIAAPLDDGPVGVLTLCFTSEERTYTAQLTTVVEEVAARAGAAVGTASRFLRQQRTSTALTEAVLPSLAAISGAFEVAARYLPVDVQSGDVGGDWFDAWELPDGRLLVGIGDVAGHGLGAATTMAMLRHAARAVALDDGDPAVVLDRLNRLLAASHSGIELATSLYAVIDPSSGVVRWASAGHPPPIVATGAGRSEIVVGDPDPPLGATDGVAFTAHEARLPAGGLLVLATDGLIESREEPVDAGLQRLAATVAAAWPQTELDQVCEDLIAGCTRGRSRTDDCCVVLVRRPEAAPPA